jgi:hypothetical protein
MPRGNAAWIHARALASQPGDFVLGFAADAPPIFASAEEMRHCALEIIAVLRRYHIDADLREQDDDDRPAQ